jgi:hypothetical protein
MIDRKQLRESLNPDHIVYLMKLLGSTEYEDRGSYIQFKTICHNVDEADAGFNLSYYKDNHRFYCFSNCHSMDIFQVIKNRWELLQTGDDTHFENLAYWVMNHSKLDIDNYSPTFISPINIKDYQNSTTEIILPEKNHFVLESFTNHHCAEWLTDGISDEAMDMYNIKYSIGRNAIIIPHYDIHNRLVGIRRRALNPEDVAQGKYKPIFIENVSYSHPLGYNLYGLNKVQDEIKRQRRVFIAEGEKAALQGRTMWGDRNVVVSACGSKINRWQVHLIMKYCSPDEIIVAFDKGLDLGAIHKMCEKYSCYCNFSYISDPFNKLKDKESPFDRSDIIDELIKTRVKVV